MTRLKQLKVSVDGFTEAKVSLRAQERGVAVSEYVRSLILRDLDAGQASGGCESAPSRPQVTVLLLEVALVTGILVRAHLGESVGEKEALAIHRRAQERAAEQIRALLQDESRR